MTQPVFIFGSARSGTSLLSRIVGSHPNIGVPFESHLYNLFYPWLKYYGNLELEKNRNRLINDILQTDVMADWDPKPDFDDIVSRLERNDFHGIVDSLMNSWLEKCGKKRWGEKTPWHMFFWKEILQGFPDAKFIFIVRDGRDASLSWKQARFGPKHIYHLAKRWKNFLDVYEEFKKSVPKENLFELRYEDLLDKPEEIARGICDTIGEDYSDEMLSFHKDATPYPTDINNDTNLSKPLMQSNKEKWRKKMTQQELRIFEAIAGKKLKQYGYTCVVPDAHIGNLEKLYITLLLHPVLRFNSMARNIKGLKDGIIMKLIYFRLRLHSLFNN